MKLFKKMLVVAMALCLALSCLSVSAATDSPNKGKKATQKTDKITIKTKAKKTVKKSKLKKKNYSFKLSSTAKSSKKVTYKKISGCKYIKVSSTGKITIKKSVLKKCTPKSKIHKIKVKVYTTDTKTWKKTSTTKIFKITIK